MRVLENIYLIPSFVNSYLMERENDCVLIDTGMSKKAKNIILALKSHCPDKPLKAIIITHAHLDHTRGLETLCQLYEPEVVAHKDESAYIMKTERMPSKSGFFNKITDMFSSAVSGSGHAIDQLVTNEKVVYGLKVLYLPGHTPALPADSRLCARICQQIQKRQAWGFCASFLKQVP